MVAIIVSALMWALTIVLLIFRRSRKDRSVLYASAAITLSLTMSDDDLYLLVDGWFGARDIVHLLSAIMLMAGVYFLARGLAKARVKQRARDRGELILLGAAVAVTTISFFRVPHKGGTTLDFMITYGERYAAATYSSAQYIYIAIVLVAMAVIAIQTLRATDVRRERAAAIFMFIGALFGIALSVDIVFMNITHVLHMNDLMYIGQTLYGPLNVAAIGFLVIGLASAPIIRWVSQRRWDRLTAEYLADVTPLWEEATTVRPSLRLEKRTTSDELRLHRRIVEIRDAAIDRRNAFSLDDEQRTLLDGAESHLAGGRV